MFVKISEKRVLNLNNVTQMYKSGYDNRLSIVVEFAGSGDYERFYSNSDEYKVLNVWMDEQPTLLHD